MDKSVIPVSPVVDRTENPARDAAEKIRSKRRRARRSAFFRRAASLFCSVNLVVCSLAYAAGNADEDLKDKLIYGVLLGGVTEKTDRKPIYETPSDTLPVLAIPLEDEKKNETVEDTDRTVEAFVKLYDYDLSLVPEGLYPIIPYDLSSEADGVLRIFNDTSFDIDLNYFAKAESETQAYEATDGPLVLIIHTHGTEAYSEEGILGYSDTYNVPRSYDVTKNMIHIGAVMTEVLNENGIPTVQCDVMHDAESYLGAYERSAATIERYLERYPSIQYVFDVHRDSVLLADKTKTRPVTIANNEVAAQIMTVAGSDELGTYHPDWRNNIRFAAKLQAALNESYLGLARAVCLRGSSYNQELAPCSLLFEVGSCGNTLKEAETSARLLAETLAALIKQGW